MESPERKIAKLTCLSCKHTFSSSGNLYKHYKTFSDHRPEGKPFISCKKAADEYLDRNLSPYHRKARLKEFFNGRLSKEELLELALPQVTSMVQTSPLIDSCTKSARSNRVKSGKRQSKMNFLHCARIYSQLFPHSQKNLPCLAILQ